MQLLVEYYVRKARFSAYKKKKHTVILLTVVNTTKLETSIYNLYNHLNVIAQLLIYVS